MKKIKKSKKSRIHVFQFDIKGIDDLIAYWLSRIGNTDKRTHNWMNRNSFNLARSSPDLGSLMITKPCIPFWTIPNVLLFKVQKLILDKSVDTER